MAETVVTEVRALSSDGAGIGALADGRVLFVPKTAPGDRVEAEVVKARPRWARGRLIELLDASEIRTEPRCSLFRRCGGCQLQHVTYDEQLRWKGRWIKDALERIGGLEVPTPEVLPSPDTLGYRGRVDLTLRRLQGGRVLAGFHEEKDGRRIVDMHDECRLPVREIREVWSRLRQVWGPAAERLPSGPRLRLTLRVSDDGVGLLVKGGRNRGEPERLLAEVEGLEAIWLEDDRGRRSHAAGLTSLREEWLGETFALTPESFVQVNRPAALELMQWVLEQVRTRSPRRVVDAFAGVGVYGRRLAREGIAAIAIELSEPAVEVARQGAPAGLEVVCGRVEDLLPTALPADLVILNPPRSGVHPSVPSTLAAHAVPTLVYVSCDPATLARDLERLGSAYEITATRAQDLFPQTSHVETVVVCQHRRPGN